MILYLTCFQKIRLHAYFNDPNIGFMEVPEDDDDPLANEPPQTLLWLLIILYHVVEKKSTLSTIHHINQVCQMMNERLLMTCNNVIWVISTLLLFGLYKEV